MIVGILLFYMVLVLLTVSLCKWVWKKKRSKLLILAIITIAVICILGGTIYFGLVFLNAHTRSMTYYELRPKQGYTLPTIPNECKAVLDSASMNPKYPHMNKSADIQEDTVKGKSSLKVTHYKPIQPPEYHDYASVWLLDHARTNMYDSAILKSPACFNFLMQEMAATRNHFVLVIYDRQLKSEVLIVRNYNK